MLITNLKIQSYNNKRLQQCAVLKKSTKKIKCSPPKATKHCNKYSNNINKTRKKNK